MYDYRKLTPKQREQIVQERLARGFPPHQPPRSTANNQTYLLTAACFEHKPHLSTVSRRTQLLDKLFQQFTMREMQILAWVILPNHYHLLVHVPTVKQLGHTFKKVHSGTSYEWNLEDKCSGRKVWYRYTDRAIRSERHYYTTLNYIHFNPVKHGCIDSPYKWGHSSIHWYLKEMEREWLRDLWRTYPVRDYGKGWDTFGE